VTTIGCKIQGAAHLGKPIIKPQWPMLVLHMPKGLSGPKKFHGEYIEGSFLSHQVLLPASKTPPEELQALDDWLSNVVLQAI
jgi:xylulose-5-phosphate/fructose-6-phosphate phosphoketolase